MTRAIWWVRRDLRLQDNSALTAALADHDEVIPVFILDDHLLSSARLRGPRVAWLLDGLRVLDQSLVQLASGLIVRRGDPLTELIALCRESGAASVYFNRDYGPYATRRDQTVTQTLTDSGITVKVFKDLVLHEAGEVLSGQGTAYGVYTPYRNRWLTLPKPAPLNAEASLIRMRRSRPITGLPVPSANELDCQPVPEPIVPPGEGYAAARLAAFATGPIYAYEERRNLPAEDGSAILSPYLRWGMISPRQCYQAAVRALEVTTDPAARASVHTWINELAWREFFSQVLAAHPESAAHNFRRQYDAVAWENSPVWLAAWSAGQTGYPIVDAAMRQLLATGWMHNRTRMIVASFLCKDLLVDWRHGEAIFMRILLDGDVASNVGNWQWAAGTGTDAAPYFRIFNPTTQGEKFDPDGAYIRRWVPELAAVPVKYIHAPGRMTPDQQRAAGCVIGRDYPLPIVDHAVQRQRALAMYNAARSS